MLQPKRTAAVLGLVFVSAGCLDESPAGSELTRAVTSRDNVAIAEALKESSPDELDRHGAAPLIVAAFWGDAEGVRLLLGAGGTPDIRDRESGATALILAAARVDDEGSSMVELLLDMGADPCIDASATDGRYSLDPVLDSAIHAALPVTAYEVATLVGSGDGSGRLVEC